MKEIKRIIGKCRIVKNEYQEYVVKAWDIEGKRYESADYYTNCKHDAQVTMQAMLTYAYTKDGI